MNRGAFENISNSHSPKRSSTSRYKCDTKKSLPPPSIVRVWPRNEFAYRITLRTSESVPSMKFSEFAYTMYLDVFRNVCMENGFRGCKNCYTSFGHLPEFCAFSINNKLHTIIVVRSWWTTVCSRVPSWRCLLTKHPTSLTYFKSFCVCHNCGEWNACISICLVRFDWFVFTVLVFYSNSSFHKNKCGPRLDTCEIGWCKLVLRRTALATTLCLCESQTYI